jgi:hypothetical protein
MLDAIEISRPSGASVRRRDVHPSWRIFINLLVTLAMFIALFHGLRGTAEPAPTPELLVTASANHAVPAELPDQQLPGHGAHCAHCLCHAGYHAEAAFNATATAFCGPIYALGDQRSTRLMVGLPPFKPPRT